MKVECGRDRNKFILKKIVWGGKVKCSFFEHLQMFRRDFLTEQYHVAQ